MPEFKKGINMTQQLWLVRLGKYGENETEALNTGDLVTGWDVGDLGNATNRNAISEIVEASYPNCKAGTLKNWAVQLNQLRNDIQQGDLIIIPLKTTREIAIGEVSAPLKPSAGSGETALLNVLILYL